MKSRITGLALVVRDYDEAIDYYTQTLGFDLEEDEVLSETKRWVRVRPHGSECSIILAKAKNEQEMSAIGNQTGGRVFLFLHVDDFQETYARYKANGVDFIEEPRNEAFGQVVVFKDLYGNKWDMIEAK